MVGEVACNTAVKLMMPLEDQTFQLLDQEATKRGVSVQELLRAVVVPDWLKTKSNTMMGLGSDTRKTLGSKLIALERAFQDLRAEVEKGLLKEDREFSPVRPSKLMHSIEDSLIRSFGRISATNLLYEMGKEAGRNSAKRVEKETSNISALQAFRQICRVLTPVWGWESLETSEFDLEKRLARSRGMGSIYLRNRTGKTPTCHFGRGLVAGVLEVILRTECESIEIACEGRGDNYCELIAGAPAQIARLAEGLDGTPMTRL